MKIKDIKFGKLIELALEQQELQGNTRNPETSLSSDSVMGNFNWGSTNQGDEFWALVDMGDYEEAREIFDWDKEVFKRGEEVEVSDDKVNWYKTQFVDNLSDLFPEFKYPILAFREESGCIRHYRHVRKLPPKIKLTKTEIAERLGIEVDRFEIEED